MTERRSFRTNFQETETVTHGNVEISAIFHTFISWKHCVDQSDKITAQEINV